MAKANFAASSFQPRTPERIEQIRELMGESLGVGCRVTMIFDHLASIGRLHTEGSGKRGMIKTTEPLGDATLATVRWETGETSKVNMANLTKARISDLSCNN